MARCSKEGFGDTSRTLEEAKSPWYRRCLQKNIVSTPKGFRTNVIELEVLPKRKCCSTVPDSFCTVHRFAGLRVLFVWPILLLASHD